MNDVSFVAGEGDAGLRDRLEEELSAFNAAVTGHHDSRLLSISVRGDRGDLRAGLYGWMRGGAGSRSECGPTDRVGTARRVPAECHCDIRPNPLPGRDE